VSGVLATPTPAPDPSRQIAYTAAVTLRVGQVNAVVASVVKAADDSGGFVFSESVSNQGTPDASLSLRIPPAQFRPVLAELAALGSVLNEDISAEDVTGQVTDLTGRLKTASASTDRLRGLLDRATATSDIVAIESALEQREQEIETLQGQINELATRVNYATIDLKITEHGTAKVSKNIPGFSRGLHGGWVAFINVGKALLTALGATLPFLPFVALIAAAIVWYRRWRRAHPRPPRPRGPSWPPSPGYPPRYNPQPSPPQPWSTAEPPRPEPPVAAAPANAGGDEAAGDQG
jgi:hypothetical protein